jgi:hypothetical protein
MAVFVKKIVFWLVFSSQNNNINKKTQTQKQFLPLYHIKTLFKLKKIKNKKLTKSINKQTDCFFGSIQPKPT